MKKAKQQLSTKVGYKVTDTQGFLGLSDEEMAVIDLKISLIQKLRDLRKASGVTQKQLAKLMKSSQSRIAMLESGASDASLELICRALFTLGFTPKELGKAVSSVKAA
jgi:DNA-binding XRE family transcriptional regulator